MSQEVISTPKAKPMLASRRELVAFLAFWAIKQSPFTLPDDFVSVVLQFDLALSKRWDTEPRKLGFMYFTRDSLTDLLRSTLMAIPEFKDWNLSAREKAAGVGVDDPARRPFVLSSRFDEPAPQHDFIDLDALIRNICNSVQKDQVK